MKKLLSIVTGLYHVHRITLALVATASLAPACVEESFLDEEIAESSFEISRGDHDYLFVLTPKNWHEARTICQVQGYNLVTVNDGSEESWLASEQSSHGGGSWWLGYHDTIQEGLWFWADGSQGGYTNWLSGQPDNAPWVGEDCAIDNWNHSGQWNDLECFLQAKFICERSAQAPPNDGSFSYSASNTNSASQNTRDFPIHLFQGMVLTVGTCGVPGASVTGDTFLRINNPSGQEIAANDDSCGGLGSNLSIVAPVTGTYVIRAGCYSSGSCGGTVAYSF